MSLSSRAGSFLPALLAFLIFNSIEVSAQPVPIGGQLRGENIVSTSGGSFIATPSGVYEPVSSAGDLFYVDSWKKSWTPPNGTTVVSMTRKFGFFKLLILLSDGSVYEVPIEPASNGEDPLRDLIPLQIKQLGKCVTDGTGSRFTDIFGDAIYAQSSYSLYVTRDDGKTWAIDSIGLEGATLAKAAIDTLQNVYAATSKGVFWQHPDSSVWHKFTDFPAPRAVSFFVDRRNRFYVGVPDSGIYLSENRGLAWTKIADSKDIRPLGYSDDAVGNVFIITAQPGLYLLGGGTGPFSRIDSTLLTLTGKAGVTFNSLSGDSILIVGTSQGLFHSSDKGSTWKDGNMGIATENFYDMARGPDGRMVLSTGLGIFSKPAGDSAWVSSTPPGPNPFARSLLYQDRQGNVFTYTSTSSTYFPIIYKSADGGQSWSGDSSAFNSLVLRGVFHLDELGNQYIGLNGWSSYGKVYKKAAGGSTWAIDTAGMQAISTSSALSMASDGSGYLYLSGSYNEARLLRKPIGGGDWRIDTVGLPKDAILSELASDGKGAMYAASYTTLYHREAAGWVQVPKPSRISTSSISQISVDSLGRLFVSFYKSGGNGVYATKDMGASWIYVGLDSASIREMVSFGDKTYALTSNGAYRLEFEEMPTNLGEATSSFETMMPTLSVAPALGGLAVRYTTHKRSPVSLKVLTLQGRLVRVVRFADLGKGTYTSRLSLPSLGAGVYLCQLAMHGGAASKKFVMAGRLR